VRRCAKPDTGWARALVAVVSLSRIPTDWIERSIWSRKKIFQVRRAKREDLAAILARDELGGGTGGTVQADKN